MRLTIRFFVVTALAVLVAAPATALPRYAARYGQDCNLCHVNPNGGGMRSSYASQFLVPTEMTMNLLGEDALAELDPQIGPQLAIGADARMLYVGADDERFRRNFFLMQADVYFDFQMTEKLSLYMDLGKSRMDELFGIAHVLPYNGYVKAGQFVPDYGWRRDDHNAFTRSELGFFPPAYSDVGVEAGIYPGSLAITAGLWNGAPGSSLDTDSELAAGARVAARFSMGTLQGALGGSVRLIPSDSGDRTTLGPLAYLNWGRFTWVAEVAIDQVSSDADDDPKAMVHSQEFSVKLSRGLDLLLTADFHDPDIDVESGARTRWGGGIAAFVNPFVRIDGLVRSFAVDDGPDISQAEYVEFILQAHLLY